MDDGTRWVMLAAVIIVLIAGGASWLLQRRRSDVWGRFAKRHRLQFVRGADGVRVEGHWKGREFLLSAQHRGSDAEFVGMQPTRMELRPRITVPHSIIVTGVEPAIGHLAEKLGADLIEPQNSEWEPFTLVDEGDPAAAHAFLTPARRRALLELASASGAATTGLENGRVFWEDRLVINDPDVLEEIARRLHQTAIVLES